MTAIQKTMISCQENGQVVRNHFNASIKMVPIDFKNTQTEEKLKRDQVTSEDTAIDTHYFVGDQVRKAIEAIHAPLPETLPSAPSIRKLVEERRRSVKKQQ